ncbi:MAG TPA: winged helix-turn-helix domain-containing protein [Usitatibacter sp.]|nr:winged helix-turn-helix domain-containing protein [Usitatibacter sp.]
MQGALRVGEWTVEPALDRLSAAGKTVKLESKAMAVLVYLAERPGEVVGRETLLAEVWKGVFVGDDSLTQVVIKLRKALGDDPDRPKYIETITKRGYRLIAPVTRGAVRSSPRLPWLSVAGITAALLGAFAAWWYTSSPELPPLPQAAASSEAVRSAQPAIAIRAFEAIGNDPQATLLAQGITADLVTDLSKVFGLTVIGDATGDAPSTGYLVSGSVQRLDERLRLHVRLADAKTGKQLWSERFDRAPKDFFALQDELGPKILQLLPAKVSEAEMRRVSQRHTRNLEAYEYFQRGQSALLVRQKAENETAREMFRRAIALDANFARAYAALALTYAADYRNQWTADGNAALDRAFELARTAYQMNPDIAETYWVLAFVHLERRQHDLALQHLEAAVRLYPSFADGYALMGGIKTYVGRPAETVPLIRVAMRLAPQPSYLYFLLLGRAYLFIGDLEQARVNLEQALARNPANLESRVYMAAVHVIAGDQAAAGWEAEEIRALRPGFTSRAWMETDPMTDSAQKAKLAQALGQLGL